MEKGLSFPKLAWSMGLLLICCFSAYMADQPGNEGAWYSILPPLVAITLAFLTQKLFLSLGVAVFVGTILAKIPPAPTEVSSYGSAVIEPLLLAWQSLTDPTNMKILGFVFFILMGLSIVIVAGGLKALVVRLQVYIKNRKSSKVVTVLLGFLVFIDDYANTMIVGSTMRSFTDKHKISREKLAFLVDATSAPVAGLAIVSTWIGYEVGLFDDISSQLGLPYDGYGMFFAAMGSRFYCWFMLAFVVFNAVLGRDFGAMFSAEHRSFHKNQPLRPGAKPLTISTFQSSEPADGVKLSLSTAAIPLGLMLAFVFLGMFYDGGGFSQGIWGVLSIFNWYEALKASENGVTILLLAAILCSVLASILAIVVAKLPSSILFKTIFKGIKGALLPAGILVLAWSLKATCDELKTGMFLTESLGSHISAGVLPFLVFLIAAATAFATGTSWGTMAILIPTVAPLALHLQGDPSGMLVPLCMAAILDGAIMGDHISPISDTTIMSSIATSCDLMDHVRTQMPYSLVVGLIAVVVGYIPVAFGVSYFVVFPVAIALCFLVLRFFGKTPEDQSPVKVDS